MTIITALHLYLVHTVIIIPTNTPIFFLYYLYVRLQYFQNLHSSKKDSEDPGVSQPANHIKVYYLLYPSNFPSSNHFHLIRRHWQSEYGGIFSLEEQERKEDEQVQKI